jgi:hypothetical protein
MDGGNVFNVYVDDDDEDVDSSACIVVSSACTTPPHAAITATVTVTTVYVPPPLPPPLSRMVMLTSVLCTQSLWLASTGCGHHAVGIGLCRREKRGRQYGGVGQMTRCASVYPRALRWPGSFQAFPLCRRRRRSCSHVHSVSSDQPIHSDDHFNKEPVSSTSVRACMR